MNEAEPLTGEIIVTSTETLKALETASIDMQVATAKQYPRSLTQFKKNAIAIATIDEETAESCIYRRPVGEKYNPETKKKEQQFAEGLSVRMAEIVGSCYGNLRVGVRITEQTERQVVAQGIAHDLETNFLSTSECIESTMTSDKNGKPKPYSERMRVVVAKAAMAKARRDAIFQVVPRALAKPIERAVKELLFGNASSITKWRERIAAWVKTLGIDEKRVWVALNVGGVDDLKQNEIELLIGIKTALQNGDTDLDAAFPPLESVDRFLQPRKKADAIKSEQPADENKPNTAESEPAPDSEPVISDAQKKRLYSIGNDRKLSDEEIRFICYEIAGVNSSNDLPRSVYEAVIAAIESAEPGKVIPE